jgi:hypothetical protein
MADFDLDNRNDILWHNGTTGASQAWFMNGVSRTSFSDFPSSSNRTDASGWKPMALGDFEGHGQIELLWHNGATGESEIWNVSGTPTSVGFLSSSLNFADSTSWRIEGVGDFDNDGKSDILLHNGATGVTQIWFMDGVTRKLYFEVPSSLYVADSTGWRIEGLDHFNTDTVPDIFWRNVTTGAMQIWLMNRWGNRLSALDVDSSLNQPDSNGWKCQGTGDYDYDGKPDLLWHNGATGASQVWFMNGAVRKGYASLSLNVADSSGWRIVRH